MSSSILWSSITDNTGASLTGLIVRVKLLLSVYSPSLTDTDTWILPLKSSSGVTLRLLPVTSTLALPSTEAT